jgi:hypothetical protein
MSDIHSPNSPNKLMHMLAREKSIEEVFSFTTNNTP